MKVPYELQFYFTKLQRSMLRLEKLQIIETRWHGRGNKMKIFGRDLNKEAMLKRTGNISQICGVEYSTLKEGTETGTDIARFRSGKGFNFTVIPSRGMDIGEAEYKGIPLAWRSGTGYINSSRFEPEGLGWLRSFHGGLLTTCGTTYVGEPCEDEGKRLGLHGRISNLPAKNVSIAQYWEEDEYIMCIKGKVQEVSVYGENMCLTRQVKLKAGESRIFLEDEVENLGFRRTEHMILYHINIGFPIIDEGTKLLTPATKITPGNEESEKEKGNYNHFTEPVTGYVEKVYYHSMKPDSRGEVRIELINKKLNLKFYIKYSAENLPNFVQWKMMGEREYVVGLEPSNCSVEGRNVDRERGMLKFLEPMEKKQYHLEFGVEEM